jgi:hypothetical protein
MDGESGVFTKSELPVQINSLDIKFPELSIFTRKGSIIKLIDCYNDKNEVLGIKQRKEQLMMPVLKTYFPVFFSHDSR